MLIGLKYCGGCNLNYERRRLVERARKEYPDVCFEPYDVDKVYDVVLVICGCLEECFTFTCENSVHGTLCVRSPEEYQRIQEFISSMSP